MIRRAAAAVLMAVAATEPARAQTVQTELVVSAGASTEDVEALATQIRAFGEPREHLRFLVEAAWGRRSPRQMVSDAFGGAYPYGDRLQVIEAYGEAIREDERLVLGVRAGQYRTPFGIYGRSEHAYGAFLRPPLIRYDNYYGLSNNFMEGGANVVAGTPKFQGEISVGAPRDVGAAVRGAGVNGVARVQAYHGPVIVGASYMHSKPYDRRSFVRGDLAFLGVDLRVMHSGVQIRGEWINGRPFDNVTTSGWYIDGLVHKRALGIVTLAARLEKLDYDAGRHSKYTRRATVGMRVQLTQSLVGQLNVMHQPSTATVPAAGVEVDTGLTWVIRTPR